MKKKWLRFVFFVLMAVCVMCLLVGCGDQEKEPGGGNNGIVISYYIGTPGETPVSVRVTDGSTFRISVPSRPGHVFLGLYDATDGGTQIVNENGLLVITPVADITLYAQWEAKSYTFVLDPGEGELISSGGQVTYSYGSQIHTFPVAMREGYDFVGWGIGSSLYTDIYGAPLSNVQYLDASSYPLDASGEIHLEAQWERKKVAVTFDYNDGSYRFDTQYVYYGESFLASEFPFLDTGSREVRGWSYSSNSSSLVTNDLANLTQDITLYAIWNNYRVVTFVEHGDQKQQIKVYQDTPYATYTPERFGYEFDGWYPSTSFAGNPVETVQYFNAKDTYYANWNMAEYTIRFVVGADVVGDTADMTYTIEDAVTLPTVTLENYEFVGWCDNPELTGTAYTAFPVGTYNEKTLYPKFRGIDVNVVLDAVGGSFGSSSTYAMTVEYGAKATLRVPNLEGYAFVGWFLDDATQLTDSEGALLAPYTYNTEQTLLAKYDEKRYVTVEIPYEAGSMYRMKEYYVAGETVELTFVPTNSGYTFLGYYDGDERISEQTQFTMQMPEGNVALTVRLRPNTYKVTLGYDGGFGTDLTEITVTYGEKYTLPILYKNGMLFRGWSYGNTLLTDENGLPSHPWTITRDINITPYFVEDTSGITTYYITKPEDLSLWMTDPAARFVLINDIDMTGVAYTPSGLFTGTFDGAGHTVRGLTAPLFHEVSGTVRNLTVEANITSLPRLGLEYYGIVANHLKGQGAILQVTAQGSISAQTETVEVDLGGIVGVARGESVLRGCVNYATVHGNAVYGKGSAGGIVGSAIDTVTVVDCVNRGTVAAPFAGGVAGHYNSSKPMESCENHGEITGTQPYTGGLIGYAACSVALTDSKNTGKVSGVSYTGGLIGYAVKNVTFSNCHNAADVTGTASYVGGLVGNVGGSVEAVKCSAKGTVTAEKEAGGFFGYIGSGLVTDSTVETTVTANGYVGGFVGRSHQAFTVESSRTSAEVTGTSNVGKYAGGAGTCTVSGVTVDIATADELLEAVKYGTAKGEIYTLTADIDMSGYSWTPIAFLAVLNGNGHTIKNLTIESEGTDVGMFTTLNGTVTNLTLEHISVRATSMEHVHLGALAGVITGGEVTGVTVKSGTIELASIGSGDVGGIAGSMTAAATVDGCENYAEVIGNHSDTTGSTGGILGWITAGTVTDCKNYGELNGAWLTGGIVGGINSTGGTVANCENHGDVTGTLRTGGIVGSLGHTGFPTGVKNTGAVTGTDYVGGHIGYYSGAILNLTYSGYTNEGDVSGQNYVGGLIGYLVSSGDTGRNSKVYTFTVAQLTNSGNIQGKNYIGGLFGYVKLYVNAYSGYSSSLKLNATELSSAGEMDGACYVGGLFGYVSSDDSASILQSSTAKVTISVSEAYAGAIAGKIENVQLSECSNEGSTMSATGYLIDGATYYAYLGGYVGYGYAVKKCDNAMDISYDAGGLYVGGIAGYLYGAINYCTNSGAINAPETSYVGGLVGRANYGNQNVTFNALKNSGSITGADYVGGLFGYVQGTGDVGRSTQLYTYTLTALENSGAVSGGSRVGGISGSFYLNYTQYSSDYSGNGRIVATKLTNTGDMNGSNYVGGLFGYAKTDTASTITDATSSADITGEYFIGGLAGRLDLVQLIECSNEGSSVTATGYQIDGSNNNAYVGGYVGYGYAIDGCHNAVPITYTQSGRFVGGIAGFLTGGAVVNSSNTAAITASKTPYVGGLVGYASYGCTGLTLTTLANSGDIKGADYVGGLFGHITGTGDVGRSTQLYTYTLTGLENSGAVSGGSHVGGICGYFYLSYTQYSSSYSGNGRMVATKLTNTGDVSGTYYVGGLFGYAKTDTDSTITDGTSSADIAGEYFTGGLAGRLDLVELLECSNEGSSITATGYQIDGTNNNAYVGGYVGYGYAIDSCHNAVPITYTQSGRFVGGIAGFLTGGAVVNSSNTAAITASKTPYVGGLVGYASYGCTGLNLTTLANSGDIKGADYVGGLFGHIAGSGDVGRSTQLYTYTLTGLENSGAVSGGSHVGGICGYFYLNYTQYSSSYSGNGRMIATKLTNTGDVSGTYYVGGLFGYATTDAVSSITDGTSSADITGEYFIGGLAGRLDLVELLECSNEGSTVTATGYQIDGTSNNAYVGGYVGRGYLLSGCVNTVDISYNNLGRFVGGLAGYVNGAMECCTNSGKVYAPKASYVGGLVGRASYGCTGLNLTTLANSGDITGADYVGGLFGHITGSGDVGRSNQLYTYTLTGLENSGAVNGGGYVGGICGYFYLSYTQYSSSYSGNGRMIATKLSNTADITATSVAGGLFGEFYTDSASTAQECTTEGTLTVGTENLEQTVGTSTNLTFES